MFVSTTVFIISVAIFNMNAPVSADIANPSFLCSQLNVRYSQGCSGFAAEALDRSYKTTAGYTYRGNINDYTSIPSGTLIGFPGHVGFYYNDYCGGRYCKFIDVNGPGGRVRCLNNYGRSVFFAYY